MLPQLQLCGVYCKTGQARPGVLNSTCLWCNSHTTHSHIAGCSRLQSSKQSAGRGLGCIPAGTVCRGPKVLAGDAYMLGLYALGVHQAQQVQYTPKWITASVSRKSHNYRKRYLGRGPYACASAGVACCHGACMLLWFGRCKSQHRHAAVQ